VPSFYGDGPELQRISGKGNGMNELELKAETIDEILSNNFVANPIYENGLGPINIKVIDPLKIPLGEFELKLVPKGVTQNTGNDADSLWADSTAWILTNITTGESVTSDTSLAYKNEQIILASTTGKDVLDWGMAVTINQVAAPGVEVNCEPDTSTSCPIGVETLPTPIDSRLPVTLTKAEVPPTADP